MFGEMGNATWNVVKSVGPRLASHPGVVKAVGTLAGAVGAGVILNKFYPNLKVRVGAELTSGVTGVKNGVAAGVEAVKRHRNRLRNRPDNPTLKKAAPKGKKRGRPRKQTTPPTEA